MDLASEHPAVCWGLGLNEGVGVGTDPGLGSLSEEEDTPGHSLPHVGPRLLLTALNFSFFFGCGS